jgi:hypothetical protein
MVRTVSSHVRRQRGRTRGRPRVALAGGVWIAGECPAAMEWESEIKEVME